MLYRGPRFASTEPGQPSAFNNQGTPKSLHCGSLSRQPIYFQEARALGLDPSSHATTTSRRFTHNELESSTASHHSKAQHNDSQPKYTLFHSCLRFPFACHVLVSERTAGRKLHQLGKACTKDYKHLERPFFCSFLGLISHTPAEGKY